MTPLVYNFDSNIVTILLCINFSGYLRQSVSAAVIIYYKKKSSLMPLHLVVV